MGKSEKIETVFAGLVRADRLAAEIASHTDSLEVKAWAKEIMDVLTAAMEKRDNVALHLGHVDRFL